MTQEQQVLDYMEQFGSITQLEAIRDLGIMRLGARVFDLRAAGYPIKREMETAKNRYGKPVTYARYTLERRTSCLTN